MCQSSVVQQVSVAITTDHHFGSEFFSGLCLKWGLMSGVVEFSDREKLTDRRMTWILRHGVAKNHFMLASALRAELIRIDRGNLKPTVVELVGIATLSTKTDKGKPDRRLIQRYETEKDGDGIWICLAPKSEEEHEKRRVKRRRGDEEEHERRGVKRRRGDTANHAAAESDSCDGE